MSTEIARTFKVAVASLLMSVVFASQASAGILCRWFGICFSRGGGWHPPAPGAPEIDATGAPLVIALVACVAMIIYRRVSR